MAALDSINAKIDELGVSVAGISGSADVIIQMLVAAQADGNVTPEEIAAINARLDTEKANLDAAKAKIDAATTPTP